MDAPLNFRSAFNGFNREDVVNYMEYLTARHAAEVNQLTSEIEFLKNQQPSVQDAPALEAVPAAEETEALRARIAELEERCAGLEAQLKEAAPQPVAADTSANMTQELEAYRRAERTERLAQERAALIEQIAGENAERTERLAKEHAAQVYNQANSALADATVKVDTAAAEISAMVESAMQQLSQLQAAVTGSKQTLKDAAASLYAIHSADEK